MTASDLTSAIRDYGTAKEVARTVGCSEATAARYRRGETFPDAMGLARLMGRSREIADVMLRLAGLDDLAMDLDEARLLQELHTLRAQRGAHAPTETTPGTAARTAMGARGQMADRAIARMSRALDDANPDD